LGIDRFRLEALIDWFLVGCDEDPQKAARQNFERAKERYYQGDVQAAVIELKNTLQTAPDHADGLRLTQQP
jgi:Tfp pilus assembly protein PilF